MHHHQPAGQRTCRAVGAEPHQALRASPAIPPNAVRRRPRARIPSPAVRLGPGRMGTPSPFPPSISTFPGRRQWKIQGSGGVPPEICSASSSWEISSSRKGLAVSVILFSVFSSSLGSATCVLLTANTPEILALATGESRPIFLPNDYLDFLPRNFSLLGNLGGILRQSCPRRRKSTTSTAKLPAHPRPNAWRAHRHTPVPAFESRRKKNARMTGGNCQWSRKGSRNRLIICSLLRIYSSPSRRSSAYTSREPWTTRRISTPSGNGKYRIRTLSKPFT
jgi:hypothetical protein